MSGEPVTWRVHLAERFLHIRTATLLIPAPNADAAGAEALAQPFRSGLRGDGFGRGAANGAVGAEIGRVAVTHGASTGWLR